MKGREEILSDEHVVALLLLLNAHVDALLFELAPVLLAVMDHLVESHVDELPDLRNFALPVVRVLLERRLDDEHEEFSPLYFLFRINDIQPVFENVCLAA